MFRWLTILVTCGVLATSGCGPKQALTPKEALKNLRHALIKGDGQAFADCYIADAEQRQLLAATCEYVHVSVQFEKKLTAAYGTNALENAYPRSRDIYVQFAKGKTLDDVAIKMYTITAIAQWTNHAPPLFFVKENSIWRIRSGGMEPSFTTNTAEALAATKAMTDFTRQGMAKIGKAGESAATIQRQIRTGMLNKFAPSNPRATIAFGAAD